MNGDIILEMDGIGMKAYTPQVHSKTDFIIVTFTFANGWEGWGLKHASWDCLTLKYKHLMMDQGLKLLQPKME